MCDEMFCNNRATFWIYRGPTANRTACGLHLTMAMKRMCRPASEFTSEYQVTDDSPITVRMIHNESRYPYAKPVSIY